jgi:dihydrofolate synthase / folylpolyglutamate synthase
VAADPILERLKTLHPKAIDMSLDRLVRLLGALGNPHLSLPPVVHVAGTNGKGSTLAYLRAMCEAAGERVHVYTSCASTSASASPARSFPTPNSKLSWSRSNA